MLKHLHSDQYQFESSGFINLFSKQDIENLIHEAKEFDEFKDDDVEILRAENERLKKVLAELHADLEQIVNESSNSY